MVANAAQLILCASVKPPIASNFVSFCLQNKFASMPSVVACVYQTSPPEPPTGADPVTLRYSPDGIIGEIQGTDNNGAPVKVHVDFANDYFFSVHSGPDTHRCTLGAVPHAPCGQYTALAIHEYSNWEWDPAWNTEGGGVFGTPKGFVPARTSAFRSTEAVQLNHACSRDAKRPCGHIRSGYFENNVFTPEHCSWNFANLDECFKDIHLGIQIVGNSHTRRALKTLASRGEWCAHRRDNNECVCEDASENTAFNWSMQRIGGASLNFLFSQGLHNSGSRFTIPKDTAVVVFAGQEAWDEARDNLSEYAQLIDVFVNDVKEMLANHGASRAPELVFKTAPYYCCAPEIIVELGGSQISRRYTSKRTAVMNEMYVQAVETAFPNASWWDTREMSKQIAIDGTRARVNRCASNHLDSRLAEVDTELLKSTLCRAATRFQGAT